jgi:two-component system OmpR family sensor kinase/two-component system sensor histidine kinase BaeS
MLKRLPLTLKLSLVVALAVALSTALVALTVHWAARRSLNQYLALDITQRTDAFRAMLEEYYAAQGDWRDIEPLLRRQAGHAYGMGMGMREGMAPGTAYIILVDSSGQVRYDPTMTHMGHVLPRDTLRAGIPLVVRGQTVGYLVTRVGAEESAFHQRLMATILRAGALAAVLAIAVGLTLTRATLHPLKALETATEQIAAGELGARVEVQAQDEVGALALRFNRMAADLQRQDQLRRRLMNDIAHELRTPLTVMQGHLEALQDGVFPMNQENLQPVYEQTLLLKRLVNDMRDLALAEAGQMALDRAPMDAGALLHRIAARFRPEAERRGVALNAAPDPGLPLVEADAQRMEQVLGNLLSNALRHTPAGGHVTLGAARKGAGVRITVQDTGEGIAPEDLPHIFERFYRGDRSRHRGEGHSGLGLAIARELVRAHGGEITAESALGQGASVHVDLPVERGSHPA